MQRSSSGAARVEQCPLPSAAVADLVSAIGSADGRSPVNELGELALSGARDAVCWVATSPTTVAPPIGFALVDRRAGTVQLGVHPAHRRAGVGTTLAGAASALPEASTWWAFGDSAGAQALARTMGLTKTRELYLMTRPLIPAAPTPAPDGFLIDTYRDADATQIVAVNARAFAHHPEQGDLTLDDFATLTRQPWFDPAGLIVARRDGEIVGFHWTKRHDDHTGEVYVLAVDPSAEGHGLGRTLLETGLGYLKGLGLASVNLYVEAASSRVVAMYRAAGFEVSTTDASYEGR